MIMSSRKFVTAAALCACALVSFAGTRLRFSQEECDFGDLGPVETFERTIEVRNTGPVPVRIVRVRTCCGAKASMSMYEIPPSSTAELHVSVTTGVRPGPFRKTVTVISDDPGRPMFSLALVGNVRETSPMVVGDEVELADVQAVASPGGQSKPAPRGARLSLTVAAVLVSGIVDGFNPCSFAIMISLAGILAIGGRRRRARILGGLSFCAGTFVTYMLMGFGLLRAISALEGVRLVHDIVMVFLALSLFLLSFLSFRDALRFRRIPVFSVVTLKLPEAVKNLIRRIAMSSWSGTAVVFAGFGCAFLVTLLDALCTGQVYVPVLVILAKESASARAVALLVLYNLAFMAPLVGVFVVASKTTDAFQMAKWSSRNVIPAKMALGLVFAFLGWMLWPKSDDVATGVPDQPPEVQLSAPDDSTPLAGRDVETVTQPESKKLSTAELAEGNERLEALLHEPTMDPSFPGFLAAIVSDKARDEQWRNHCLQYVPDCMLRLEAGSADYNLLSSVLSRAIAERSSVLAGTALLGYIRLSEQTGSPSADEIGDMAFAIASDASSSPENVVTALRVGAERNVAAMLPAARYWSRSGSGEFVRCVAISVVRDLGNADDIAFLRSLVPARSKSEERAINMAIKALEVL